MEIYQTASFEGKNAQIYRTLKVYCCMRNMCELKWALGNENGLGGRKQQMEVSPIALIFDNKKDFLFREGMLLLTEHV